MNLVQERRVPSCLRYSAGKGDNACPSDVLIRLVEECTHLKRSRVVKWMYEEFGKVHVERQWEVASSSENCFASKRVDREYVSP